MDQSILNSTKKILGIAPDYDVFDLDIITHINTAFATLNQIGIGPLNGFLIEDDVTEWGAFLGADPRISSVKSYVYLRVRMLFDPPNTSFALDAMKKQLEELEWRLNVTVEPTDPAMYPSNTTTDAAVAVTPIQNVAIVDLGNP